MPTAPKKPQDHKAAKAEAVPDGPIEFDHEGARYIIEPDFRDDIEIVEDIEDGKHVNVVRRILGTEQWERWKDANRGENGRVKATDAESFLKALFEVLGLGN